MHFSYLTMNKRTGKSWLLLTLIILFSSYSIAQPKAGDKLRMQISEESNPETKVDLLIKLAFFYPEGDLETERCLKEAYDISKKINYRPGMIFGKYAEVIQLSRLGRYDEAIEKSKQCIEEMDSMHVIQYLYWFPLSEIRTFYNSAGK